MAPPKPSEPPPLSEPAVIAARRLGRPAILLQPYHPLLASIESASWFGGFPKLPDHIDWPREKTGEKRPLHFMAQIDCGALPAQAADGHGFPRSGHLCFFSEIYELSETGAVLYFDAPPEHLTERLPPEDSPPVHGCEDYSTPFNDAQRPVDRAGLPHPAAMPRVPVHPFEFISYPGFAHMFMSDPLFKRPVFEGETVNDVAAALETQRAQALRDALNFDPVAAKNAYEVLVMGPTHLDQTGDIQYAGLVTQYAKTLLGAGNRILKSEKLSDRHPSAERLAQLAENLLQVLQGLTYFQRLSPDLLTRLSDLKRTYSELYETPMCPPRGYSFAVETQLRHLLFKGLVDPKSVTIPDEIKPALSWFQNPVHQATFPYDGREAALKSRGIFQMGGYCHGSQYGYHPTQRLTPLLSVGYCDLTGYKYGDGGDWTFWVSPKDLSQREFSSVGFAADCH
ncbi:MAG: DUF1963 domain-containing protein [Litorimonas sp.]